jgi:hypothetical protein
MKFKIYLFIFCLLINVVAFAESTKKLVISYVEHSAVEKVYLPLIKAMYEEANIDVEFFYVDNSARSIKGLNDGLYDAYVGKTLSAIEAYENIIYVPTPLSKAGMYLACAKKMLCSKSLLLNQDIEIASPYTLATLQNVIPIKANVILISSKAKTTKMLELGRVDYIIFGDDTQTKMDKLQREFQVVEIKAEYIYHVLHTKHHSLIPRLNKALKIVINKHQTSKLVGGEF